MKKLMFILIILSMCASFAFAAGEKEKAATTAPVRSGKYGEAPMLAELVAAGKLPPVEERLPLNPLVLTAEKIGLYGGRLVAPLGGDFEASTHGQGCWSADTLLRFDFDKKEAEPGFARGYDVSADKKVWVKPINYSA